MIILGFGGGLICFTLSTSRNRVLCASSLISALTCSWLLPVSGMMYYYMQEHLRLPGSHGVVLEAKGAVALDHWSRTQWKQLEHLRDTRETPQDRHSTKCVAPRSRRGRFSGRLATGEALTSRQKEAHSRMDPN